MIKFFISLSALFLMLVSCNKKETLSQKQLDIVDDIIVHLDNQKKLHIDKSYIINPRLNYFEVNSYFKRKLGVEEYDSTHKEQILNELNITNKEFEEIKKSVNQCFYGKYYTELSEKSKSLSSKTVVTLSGFHDDLVFLEVIDYCDEYFIDQINTKDVQETKYVMNVFNSTVLIKDGRVKKIISNGGFSSEVCTELRE